jgi:hypothetical protein
MKYFTDGVQSLGNISGNMIDLIANASKSSVAAKTGILVASKTSAVAVSKTSVLAASKTGALLVSKTSAIAVKKSLAVVSLGSQVKDTNALLLGVGEAAASASSKVLPHVLIGIGVVATAVDVALLIKDWKSKHPSLKYADELIKDLNNDIQKLEAMIKFSKNWIHYRNRCVDDFNESTNDDSETTNEFYESASEGSHHDF